MEIRIPYGKSFITAQIPDQVGVDIFELPHTPAASNPTTVVRDALNDLLGELSWSDLKEVQSVAIAINDKTRPVPHYILLPPLLDQLESLGIPNDLITFFIAVGTHPPMTPEEFPTILPAEILACYQVVSLSLIHI